MKKKTYLDPSFEKELNKLPEQVKKDWKDQIAKVDTIESKKGVQYSDWMIEAVRKLNDHKVPFMAGTDTPIGFLIPGRSLHRELELLVQSGLSRLEAIQAATINPARFFGLENKIGRVKNGFTADLLILNANPLDKITNTQNIHAVIKQGHYHSRQALDRLLFPE